MTTNNRKRRVPTESEETNENANDSNINQPEKKRIKRCSQDEVQRRMKKWEELEGMQKKELKDLCRKHGLKVGGNKSELITRLAFNDLSPQSSSKPKPKKKRVSVKQVHKMLSDAGIDEPEKVNNCLKKGIQKGYYILQSEADLDRIIYSGECIWCRKGIDVSLRDCLYQADCGDDYYDGGEEGAIQCDGDGGEYHEKCWGIYITQLCEGSPSLNSGKFHNHCTECPGFGKCIGDYRESHCSTCKKHWFEGNSGFPCTNCGKHGDMGGLW
eukprot:1962_1